MTERDDQAAGSGSLTADLAAGFTLENYETVLFVGIRTDSMAKAFFNTLTVTIPATIIPILIAAFAAYALAWMDFRGGRLLIAAVVGCWWCRCNWR
jgi:alpha-glucoside transport system permease protein